ncbi:hypothetical protein EIP91_003928 [Steccherinum ochraceum]|uniref:F-box domain-containing protein n=1 Tax=Steccherinum ochraceum TaxID=92696 RepID=A0A4R0RWM5_9APHY|nr:hypothetical protein EIP91_003928 [Steccherinum ochraceum]
MTEAVPFTVRLPNELWDAVLSVLQQQKDRDALSSFAFTSRRCRHLALPYIFSKLSVAHDPCAKSSRAFLPLILSSPLIATFIHDLTLHKAFTHAIPAGGKPALPPTLGVNQLAQILQALPALRKLTVNCDLSDADPIHGTSSPSLPLAIAVQLDYLTLNIAHIRSSGCPLSTFVRFLSLFSTIDHLVVNTLPYGTSCVCRADSLSTETHEQATDEDIGNLFHRPGHILPSLTIRSINSCTGISSTSQHVFSHLFAHLARTSDPHHSSCSLILTFGNPSSKMCQTLIAGYGSRLGHCDLKLGNSIHDWPTGSTRPPRCSTRIDLSSCTSLTSLAISGVWFLKLRDSTTALPGAASFAFADILSSVHPSTMECLTLSLKVLSGLHATSVEYLRDCVFPLVCWRDLRLVLLERFSALRQFTLQWTLLTTDEFSEVALKWMRETIEEELGQWVKTGVLKVELATRR